MMSIAVETLCTSAGAAGGIAGGPVDLDTAKHRIGY